MPFFLHNLRIPANTKDEVNAMDHILSELPMGLGMALAQNMRALVCFAAMTPEEQRAVINRTHTIHSKQEMRDYVAGIADQTIL